MNKIQIFLIAILFSICNCDAQLQMENMAIRDQFGNGKISPDQASILWNNLQKKYGDNPITIENYGWQAYTYFSKGNNFKAIELFKIGLNKANFIKNDTLTFKFLSDLASVYRYSGEFELAQNTFNKASEFYKINPKIQIQIPEYAVSLHLNLGKFKLENGDYAEGLINLEIAKKIAIYKNLETSKSFIYGNISDIYINLQQLDNAKINLQEAINYPANFDDLADKYLKLAEIEYEQGNWQKMAEMLDLAEKSFKKSIKRKAGSIFPLFEIGILNANGKLNMGLKNFEMANAFFNQSIEKGLKYFKTNTTTKSLIKSYKDKAKLNFLQQNYPSTLQNLQKALQYNSINFKSENIAQNPKIESLKYKNDAIEIFKEKMIALLSVYKKEGKKQYLDYALATAAAVNQLINYQRNSFQLEGSKLFLSEQVHAIYGLAIEAAYLKYEQTNDPKFIELAFKYSEANKAVVLFESIKANEKLSFVGVPQTLIDQEIIATKNMAIFENQLYKDAKNATLWRKKLIDVTDVLAKLKVYFKKEHPQYYNFKYNTETIAISETQTKLAANQAVIEYYLSTNKLYSFIITKTKSAIIPQKLPANFNQIVTNYKNLILAKSISQPYQKLSNQLYKTLFTPKILAILTAEKIENLKIIGDGAINYIPLEALLTKPVKSLKETNIYLIEKYTIGYLPSATMNWKNIKPATSKWFRANYFGFAPSYKANLNLPDNQANVSNLANEFSGESFLEENANLINFNKYSSQNSKILHLSMHGGASASNLLESFLAFENDSIFVHDIYTKTIPSELAILDACETGMGILNNGEGLLNLARAFLHAGSQAVAMSLWKLSSSPETAKIIADFAKLVVDGSPKDEAIGKAKLNYLAKNRNDLNLGHPFYWAPLIIIGNAEPIEPSYYKYWLLLLAILIIYSWSSYRHN